MMLVIILSSCSKKRSYIEKSREPDTSKTKQFELKTDNIRRVDLVQKIEPMLPTAISEKWSKETWIQKFGPPWREEKVGSEYELLEYSDSGPFKNSGKELITGVIIKLQSGHTFDYELQRTTFGMPDYLEIDSDGKTKVK